MVNLRQFVWSILPFYLPYGHIYNVSPPTGPPKSIAIIGAGSAGLAMLKSLVDLPQFARKDLTFVLLEEREDVGGVWLPDTSVATPPELPKTPLYPLLHSNTPVPSMSYPGFPFPPGTPLYPSHDHIERYHQRYVTRFKLKPYIRFQHRVLETHWNGTPEKGLWNVTIQHGDTISHAMFDHLVVATGNNQIPHIPSWPGQQRWLDTHAAHSSNREITHSIYYREPQRYTNKSVLVVGTGASGRDAANQISLYAKKTYVSTRHKPKEIDGAIQIMPEISHFTDDVVVFVDGSSCSVDTILLATGYELRKPFLDAGRTIVTDPSAHSNSSTSRGLVTNTRYIFPLHRHILSLCPSYPTNALAFIGLPKAIANCPSDVAQSIFVTHTILHPNILPSREELLKELATHEQEIRHLGLDPYILGHQIPEGKSSDYQDELIAYLKEKGALPNDGKKFVEAWRRDIFDYQYLKRGWKRIEQLATEKEWLEGVETEEQWADLMQRINHWQEKWEKGRGIPFVREPELIN